jgi:hypothetical protein
MNNEEKISEKEKELEILINQKEIDLVTLFSSSKESKEKGLQSNQKEESSFNEEKVNNELRIEEKEIKIEEDLIEKEEKYLLENIINEKIIKEQLRKSALKILKENKLLTIKDWKIKKNQDLEEINFIIPLNIFNLIENYIKVKFILIINRKKI